MYNILNLIHEKTLMWTFHGNQIRSYILCLYLMLTSSRRHCGHCDRVLYSDTVLHSTVVPALPLATKLVPVPTAPVVLELLAAACLGVVEVDKARQRDIDETIVLTAALVPGQTTNLSCSKFWKKVVNRLSFNKTAGFHCKAKINFS